jgi:hypothetical protein
MPLKLIRQNHWEIIGRGPTLLSSPPATDQPGEFYTGRIVEEAALLSKAHAIISKEAKFSPNPANPPDGSAEFEASKKNLIKDLGIRCVLVILGKNEPGIEIRTLQASSGTVRIDLISEGFGSDFEVITNPDEPGKTDEPDVQTFTLALGPDERDFRKELLTSRIADIVGLINSKS